MTYYPNGNIKNLTNSGNAAVGGTYAYDPNHPHAVSTVTNITGTNNYDANGNMLCRFGTWNGTSCSGGTQITWNAGNLPTQITGPTGSSTFFYSPDMQRYQQIATDSSGNVTNTTYIGSLFEVVSNSSGTQYRHNIMAVGGVVAVHTIHQSGTVETDYIHSDHLGSGDVITDDTGNIAMDPVTGEQQIMSFDVFGLRRDPNNWAYDLTTAQIGGLKAKTDKGYTAQEQLDNVGLVHMNGRVYDPSIGRMISADPTVPNPFYSQAFNRYAYVNNNPLNATDPSGFKCTPQSTSCSVDDAAGTYTEAGSGEQIVVNAVGESDSNPSPTPSETQAPATVAPQAAVSQIGLTAIILDPVHISSQQLSSLNGPVGADELAALERLTGITPSGGPCDCEVQSIVSAYGTLMGGGQCDACTGAAFGKTAGPGALDGMAESVPKAQPVVVPFSYANGSAGRLGDRAAALNNIPRSPSAAVGLMRQPNITGTMGPFDGGLLQGASNFNGDLSASAGLGKGILTHGVGASIAAGVPPAQLGTDMQMVDGLKQLSKISKGLLVTGSAAAIALSVRDFNHGDWAGGAQAGLDGIMGAAGEFGGPYGFALTLGYTVMTQSGAADGIGNWLTSGNFLYNTAPYSPGPRH